MESLTYFQTMGRYNRWMNEKLYAVCETIPDEVRKADKGAFFRSMHGILNHLLLTDKIWLGRFTNQPFAFRSLDQELYSDFAELKEERQRMDAALEAWADALTEDVWTQPFTYTNSQGQTGTFLLGHLVMHVFNHQTHHRGQLTTLLNQCGYDSGITDLPFMPGVRL